MWFSGGFGSSGLMAGLNDLRGLFQPKPSYDFKCYDMEKGTIPQTPQHLPLCGIRVYTKY